MRNGVPFSNSRVTLSDPTMPELYSTDGGNIYFVSRNLTLDNTMDADSGTYTCVASNGNAVTPSVTQDFEVFVNGKLDLCNNGDSLYVNGKPGGMCNNGDVLYAILVF